MRFGSSVVLLATAGVAVAQSVNISSLLQYADALLSANCTSTLELLVTNSTLATCLHVTDLAPILTSNSSIIPYTDKWLADVCYTAPCTNATLTQAASTVISGCAADLTKYNITNATIYDVVGQYPLAREVACLKTTKPFNATNVTAPATPYNTTNGTFCATSLLTELQSYLGANLSLPYIATAALGGNATVVQLIEKIPTKALCSDCIFAAVDLIEEQYPWFGNISLGAINGTNTTLNQFLVGTCNATYNITKNGTLPSTITESAVNSTFPFNVTAGNVTYHPSNSSSAIPALNSTGIKRDVDVTAAKRRWFGRV